MSSQAFASDSDTESLGVPDRTRSGTLFYFFGLTWVSGCAVAGVFCSLTDTHLSVTASPHEGEGGVFPPPVKALKGMAPPPYLQSLIEPYNPRRALRSAKPIQGC